MYIYFIGFTENKIFILILNLIIINNALINFRQKVEKFGNWSPTSLLRKTDNLYCIYML